MVRTRGLGRLIARRRGGRASANGLITRAGDSRVPCGRSTTTMPTSTRMATGGRGMRLENRAEYASLND